MLAALSFLFYSLLLHIIYNLAPGDYQVSSITLNKDQLSSGEFEVTVQVKNDTVLEGQETFQGVLQLTQESLNLGVVRLGQRTGEVDITDDDSKLLKMCTYLHIAGFL